jgi:hypothetical protein
VSHCRPPCSQDLVSESLRACSTSALESLARSLRRSSRTERLRARRFLSRIKKAATIRPLSFACADVTPAFDATQVLPGALANQQPLSAPFVRCADVTPAFDATQVLPGALANQPHTDAAKRAPTRVETPSYTLSGGYGWPWSRTVRATRTAEDHVLDSSASPLAVAARGTESEGQRPEIPSVSYTIVRAGREWG